MLLSIHRPGSVDCDFRTTSGLFEALGLGKELLEVFQVSGETVAPFATERREGSARERLSNLFWFFCFSVLLLLFVFLRPFFRFQVGAFQTGCAGPNRLYLNANDGNAFGFFPSLPQASVAIPPAIRATEGNRTQHTCVLVPFLRFPLSYLLLATRAV